MGGGSIEENLNSSYLSNEVRTVVLVGRTGNGKSATGNTILRRKAFVSRTNSSGTDSTSELQSTVLKDGKVINVIDTPGIFDASVEPEFISKEIVKCLDMAKDGIHAIIVVLSARRHFSKEEEAVLHSLTHFCPKITDYMTVVVTGGDELEDNNEDFEDYLHGKFSEPLQNILKACKNRCVLFDNKTKDIAKKEEQWSQLFVLVDATIHESGGKPYTSGLVEQLQNKAGGLREQEEEIDGLEGYTEEGISEMKLEMQNTYEEQLRIITEKVESKIRDTTKKQKQPLPEEQLIPHDTKVQSKGSDTTMRLEEPLINEQFIPHNPLLGQLEIYTAQLQEKVAAEKDARLKIESSIQAAQQQSEEEIKKLKKDLKRAEKESQEIGQPRKILGIKIPFTNQKQQQQTPEIPSTNQGMKNASERETSDSSSDADHKSHV